MFETILAGIIAAIISGLVLDLFRHQIRKKPLIIVNLLQRFKRKARDKKLLVYLSSGGTCRDPMAKVITSKVLESLKLKDELRIEGLALREISDTKVSFAASKAIKDLYSEDLLKNYKPGLASQAILDEADLILVMDQNLLSFKGVDRELPEGKTYLFKEFFGLNGDVKDPWPDGRDAKTLNKYLDTAKEIKFTIENGIDRLVDAL